MLREPRKKNLLSQSCMTKRRKHRGPLGGRKRAMLWVGKFVERRAVAMVPSEIRGGRGRSTNKSHGRKRKVNHAGGEKIAHAGSRQSETGQGEFIRSFKVN